MTNYSEQNITLSTLSIIAELTMSAQIMSQNVSIPPPANTEVNLKIDFGNSPLLSEWKDRIQSKLANIPDVFSTMTWILDRQSSTSHLRDLLEAGVIKNSESPFSSPIAVVQKNNEDVRLCVDYCKLNLQTIKDAYALPNLE